MSSEAENWEPRGERKQINTKMRGLPYKWHMELTPEGQRAVIEPRNGLESIANAPGGTSGQVSGENAPEPPELRINGDSVEFHAAPNVEIKEIRAQTFGNKTYTRTLYTHETRLNCPNCQHKPHPGRCFNMVPVEHGENSCTCRG